MKENLTLNIISVSRHLEGIGCDYVKITVADSLDGKFSGSYGIKKGHARAVFSVGKGEITVYRNEEIIFHAETSEGFASIENNILDFTVASIFTVITDKVSENRDNN